MTSVSSRRPSYEMLGGKYVSATSAEAVASQANLDWTVSLQPISAQYVIPSEDGDNHILNLPVEDKFATVKTTMDGATPRVLGVVGSRYGVVQNAEMFSALDFLVDSGEARYTAAGEIDGGRQVYMVMELPQEVRIANDPHAAYLLARTSHDGSTSLQITSVINRLACTNQINSSFLGNKKANVATYTLRHTSNAVVRVEDIRRKLNVIYNDIRKYEQIANHLLDIKLDDELTKRFFESVWELDSKIEKSPIDMLSQGEKRAKTIALTARNTAWDIYNGVTGTQEELRGTGYGAFHAVVEYADWFSSKDETLRAERTLLGSTDAVKNRALELLGVR